MTFRRDTVNNIIRDLQSRDASRIEIGIRKLAALTMVNGGYELEEEDERRKSLDMLSKRLLQLSDDDDWRTRRAAILGLGEISYHEFDGESLNMMVLRLLWGILEEDGRVRWAAVQTLERFLPSVSDELYVETYMRLLEMRERQGGGVRRSIGQALDRMEGPRLRRVLKTLEYERIGVYTDELEKTLASEELVRALRGLVEGIENSNLRTRLRMRSAPISPDAALEEVLSRYNKNALVGMGKLIELPSPVTGLRKRELIVKIRSQLRRLDFLKHVISGLEPEERLALLDLMLKDGLMPLEEFAEKHGDDLEESPYWNWHPPETVMGRLKARGLIVEGSHGVSECILIPCELRPLLQAIQKETKARD